MVKVHEEIKEKNYFKDIHFLYEIIHLLKDTKELKSFLKDILTRSELIMLKRRWHIANLLLDGFDIRTIAVRSKASTQTVSRVKKVLEEGNGGLSFAINKAREEIEKEKSSFKNNNRHRGGSKYVKGWF